MSTEILTRKVVQASYEASLHNLKEIKSSDTKLFEHAKAGRKMLEMFWNAFDKDETNHEAAMQVKNLEKVCSDLRECAK